MNAVYFTKDGSPDVLERKRGYKNHIDQKR